MVSNASVLKQRTLSAIVFVIVMLTGLIWNAWSFFTLFLIIQLGCLYEYQKLLALIYPSYQNISPVHKWGLLVVGCLMMMTLGPVDLTISGISIKYIGSRVLPFVLALMIIVDIFMKKINLQNWAISFAGLVYIPMCLSLFFQLKSFMTSTYFGSWTFSIPLLLIVSIWVNDTMAYLVGSVIGKTPLSPISPNKTWEGTIAGIILSVLIVSKGMALIVPIQEKYIFYISLIASITGNFGDLLESKLKRLAGVKDSGSMMPGHGGFLDRFDSILFATPFVWLILQILF
ncbi:MAG: phosphatidate cytidylyltransferase [Chitinophagaceae bacterium]|jgi:phosphatidate cytidylyltransferase|nr:phosphatidate cytidylyltransferase [Chitinophagaceae bacterium]